MHAAPTSAAAATTAGVGRLSRSTRARPVLPVEASGFLPAGARLEVGTDVPVDAEQVVGVVLLLDRQQTVEVVAVRLADSVVVLVGRLEVDVRTAGRERSHLGPGVAHPLRECLGLRLVGLP